MAGCSPVLWTVNQVWFFILEVFVFAKYDHEKGEMYSDAVAVSPWA